jgi:guanosine-3',5'-bis(diphosphate) 3'-pyrophosphohydrolase
LADRLHNMRTLDHMRSDKRVRIAEETMEIYAPLAGRMGMQDMREELEELAFRTINPEAHRTVTERLKDVLERNRNVIAEIERSLLSLFEKYGIEVQVKGRQKKPWSVFRKMETKALSFEQLSDIFGFRVVLGTIEGCYLALGAIHTTWSMVPGRFKDYISTPKQNDYRSIHTTIVGPSRQRIELQIRTRDMDDVAEYGVAAHSLYKDGTAKAAGAGGSTSDTNAYAWLRRTIEQLSEGDSPEDFLENTKLELFHDQVFCFTPKGMLIALPRGATPIDFAYAVHTDIGDTCVGAKVNGRIMPLMTELKNGDEVDIIRSKAQVPPAAWESVVVTGKARSAIRRATKNAIRKQYSGLGTRILERAFERAGKAFSKEKLKPVLHRLARKDVEDVLAAVGRGELASSDVVKAVFPDYKDERVTPAAPRQREEGWYNLRNAAGMLFQIPGRASKKKGAGEAGEKGEGAVPIRGVRGDLPVRFAPEGAVPGDRIVGIMQPGSGITVYPIQSPSLTAFDDQPERWIDVRWDIDETTRERFPARISVTAINAPGSLAEIAQVVAANDANIHTLSMVRTAPDFTEMAIDLEVWDLKHLNRLLSQLKDNAIVSEAKRVNG